MKHILTSAWMRRTWLRGDPYRWRVEGQHTLHEEIPTRAQRDHTRDHQVYSAQQALCHRLYCRQLAKKAAL